MDFGFGFNDSENAESDETSTGSESEDTSDEEDLVEDGVASRIEGRKTGITPSRGYEMRHIKSKNFYGRRGRKNFSKPAVASPQKRSRSRRRDRAKEVFSSPPTTPSAGRSLWDKTYGKSCNAVAPTTVTPQHFSKDRGDLPPSFGHSRCDEIPSSSRNLITPTNTTTNAVNVVTPANVNTSIHYLCQDSPPNSSAGHLRRDRSETCNSTPVQMHQGSGVDPLGSPPTSVPRNIPVEHFQEGRSTQSSSGISSPEGDGVDLCSETTSSVTSVLGELTNTLKQIVSRLDKQEVRLASIEKKMVSSPTSGSSSGGSQKLKVPLAVRVSM